MEREFSDTSSAKIVKKIFLPTSQLNASVIIWVN